MRPGAGSHCVDEFHANKQAMAFLEELERSKDTPQTIQCIDFSCFSLSSPLTSSRRHRERRLHAVRRFIHRQPAPQTARAASAREQFGSQSDHLPHQPTPFRIAQRLQSLHFPRPARPRPQQYFSSLSFDSNADNPLGNEGVSQLFLLFKHNCFPDLRQVFLLSGPFALI